MDYDATDIPVIYDRGRDHGPAVLQLWMNVVSLCVGKQRIDTILDMGCGTGRFSEALAAHFDAEVIGIDPSQKMLDQARKKPDYAAYAEKLSAGADSVLAQLTPNDFQAGIEAMRAQAGAAAGQPVTEPIDVFVFR